MHFWQVLNLPDTSCSCSRFPSQVMAYVPFLAAEACDFSGIVAIMKLSGTIKWPKKGVSPRCLPGSPNPMGRIPWICTYITRCDPCVLYKTISPSFGHTDSPWGLPGSLLDTMRTSISRRRSADNGCVDVGCLGFCFSSFLKTLMMMVVNMTRTRRRRRAVMVIFIVVFCVCSTQDSESLRSQTCQF